MAALPPEEGVAWVQRAIASHRAARRHAPTDGNAHCLMQLGEAVFLEIMRLILRPPRSEDAGSGLKIPRCMHAGNEAISISEHSADISSLPLPEAALPDAAEARPSGAAAVPRSARVAGLAQPSEVVARPSLVAARRSSAVETAERHGPPAAAALPHAPQTEAALVEVQAAIEVSAQSPRTASAA